tara:strand:- start:307 stop:543 length:237 start_codon:yes stop_codon:yes gene_type:complete
MNTAELMAAGREAGRIRDKLRCGVLDAIEKERMIDSIIDGEGVVLTGKRVDGRVVVTISIFHIEETYSWCISTGEETT